MRLRAVPSIVAFLLVSALVAHTSAAQTGWHSLAPDTIGRLIIHVDVSAAQRVRLTVDTAGGKTPIVTSDLAADSVEAWAKTVEATVPDSAKLTPSADYRLGESVMMSRDSAATGHEYKLIVADSTGDHTFAVMVPPTHVARITTAIARATRPARPAPTTGQHSSIAPFKGSDAAGL